METLRVKHNQIKYTLLKNAATELRLNDKARPITMLDLGVGRANDIHKWNKLNVNAVVGIENNEAQLAEARARIKAHCGPGLTVQLLKVDLSNIDEVLITIPKLANKSTQIDMIVSFFSIHYFYNNLNKILAQFNLAPDCIFVSTFMNVYHGFLYLHDKSIIENNLIYLKKYNKNKMIAVFKKSPYFLNNQSMEDILELTKLSSIVAANFPNTTINCFLETYENISELDDNVVEVELLHQFMVAKK